MLRGSSILIEEIVSLWLRTLVENKIGPSSSAQGGQA